ncbi:hypothetical protein [Roseomonas indoligenes]|uniref:Uncharacterized protein n=1 Tax=Roseomonas indoligenes TaxID=2820811 RepID=A0A940N056_9PROT|nr:hypothetical protein [Pararoseomonas indoligenes]MBP0494094.1 hypothetical protein [Pararoseomonas indoligenes]
MSSFRILALAAALIGSAAAPAFAASDYLPGATAVPAWTAADNSRTPLASNADRSGQTLLEQSGATGGGGQHS